MVNNGRSGGCNTCKQRRIKCDEAKPECQRCHTSNLVCSGYVKKAGLNVRFRDQTQVISHRFQSKSPSPKGALSEDFETIAVSFLLRHYSTSGRGLVSNRCLFECIVPTLATSSTKSAVALATASVATLIFNIWSKRRDGPKIALQRHVEALNRVRDELERVGESNIKALLLAILLLQFQEDFCAVRGLRTATRTHYHGAIALLCRLHPPNVLSYRDHGRFLYLLNIEVSSAIRMCRLVRPGFSGWMCAISPSQRIDPSAKLVHIGILVAEVQFRFTEVENHHSLIAISSCEHRSHVLELYGLLTEVEVALSTWRRSVPEHWEPRRWDMPTTPQPDPPIPMYRDICEIYTSIPIAAIWNTWRGYFLIVLQIQAHIRAYGWIADELHHGPSPAHHMQRLVDAICYSIPFHLGNRHEARGLEDLNDMRYVYPSCHMTGDGGSYAADPTMSKEHHKQHILAKGAWHILPALSNIITLFSWKHHNCACLSDILEPSQLDWIHVQLLRSMDLVGIKRSTYEQKGQDSLEPGNLGGSSGIVDVYNEP